ncbi:MAG: DNA mismatch repair protein MutS, partial [Pyramidobacter sp.]|nr:DNA mismatch repair protein MutS [Pyramidobacter sp.]
MKIPAQKRPLDVKMTPMFEQYYHWKNKYPGCVLFFRMGDFYECFFDDAKIVSKELDIALTARDAQKMMPMAGVPYHSVDQYISRMVDKGYKIAICEQMTEPDGRTLVERQVIRVVTPGTYIPEEGVITSSLAALILGSERWTIGFLSPSSSYVQVGTFEPQEALSVLMSYAPREILVPRGKKYQEKIGVRGEWAFTEVSVEDFDPVIGKAR